uniref:Uncharacterized protein n=1 Tax=Chrysotila carterae TaxID=13221 RepID=A0A7S4F1B1_CHRCT
MRTMLLPLLLQAGASAMRAPMAGTLSRTAVSSITTVTNVHLPMRAPVVHQTRATSPVMFGPGGGGFLNLGAPEVIVIGAVAWALLGPKELYRLAREAGNFLGEWQQLGRQAQSTFKDALDREMAEEMNKPPDPNSISSKLKAEAEGAISTIRDSLPSLDEYTAQRATAPPPATTPMPTTPSTAPATKTPAEAKYTPAGAPDFEPSPEMIAEMKATLGDPETNRANFMQQVSGETNRRVMETGAAAASGVSQVQYAEESLIETQIQEAENQLATLRAEAQVLQLRRQQQEAAARRAQQQEEEKAAAEAAARQQQSGHGSA